MLHLLPLSNVSVLSFEDLTKAFGLEGRSYCPVGKIFNGVHVVVMDDTLNVKSIGDPGEVNVKLFSRNYYTAT